MNITVAGVGYVGLAQAVLLAQHNAVTAVTTTPAKAEQINRGVSPIADAEITDFLRTKPLTLTATVDAERAYRTADVVIIATPTDYDPERNLFNTSTSRRCFRSSAGSIPARSWSSSPRCRSAIRSASWQVRLRAAAVLAGVSARGQGAV